jgi:hypothetical protein
VSVRCGAGFRVTSDPEVCKTPTTIEEQYVLWFEVTMHDSPLQAHQGLRDVEEDL